MACWDCLMSLKSITDILMQVVLKRHITGDTIKALIRGSLRNKQGADVACQPLPRRGGGKGRSGKWWGCLQKDLESQRPGWGTAHLVITLGPWASIFPPCIPAPPSSWPGLRKCMKALGRGQSWCVYSVKLENTAGSAAIESSPLLSFPGLALLYCMSSYLKVRSQANKPFKKYSVLPLDMPSEDKIQKWL